MKWSFALFFLILSSVAFGQKIKFKDPKFKEWILKENKIDLNGDGEIDQREAQNAQKLDLSGARIKTMDELKYFVNLKELWATANLLKTIDVSQNRKLTLLYIDANQLKELDLSNNTNLSKLSCGHNKISTFDFSQNTKLKEAHLNGNLFTKLDLSKNTSLEYLSVRNNHQLSEIDLTNLSSLRTFYCSYTKIESLDLSKNEHLEHLLCLGISLKYLDVSRIRNLEVLSAAQNPNLKCIKVNNFFKAKYNDNWEKDEHTKYSVQCE